MDKKHLGVLFINTTKDGKKQYLSGQINGEYVVGHKLKKGDGYAMFESDPPKKQGGGGKKVTKSDAPF